MTISRAVTDTFKNTRHYRSLDDSERANFARSLEEVYFKVETPDAPRIVSLWRLAEPKFLRVIGKGDLEPSIERMLGVTFPRSKT